MMIRSCIIMSLILLVTLNSLKAQLTDRDGNRYSTVQIGSQVWMASNLDVSTFRNGDKIPYIKDADAWQNASTNHQPAWCYYENDPVNGRSYKKLYNWYAVNDPRGLAPVGWHIPSDEEWADLSDYLGGKDVAGTKMKSTTGWNNGGNGTNSSRFAGLPGGFRNNFGAFINIGDFGHWWSSSEKNSTLISDAAGSYSMFYFDGSLARSEFFKGSGLSVRCVRD
jgi:uncharacterized protein (TIGR02145 family)